MPAGFCFCLNTTTVPQRDFDTIKPDRIYSDRALCYLLRFYSCADWATFPFVSGIHNSLPFVSFIALPPYFLFGSGWYHLRCQFSIFRGMPFFCKPGICCCQVIIVYPPMELIYFCIRSALSFRILSVTWPYTSRVNATVA